MPLDGVREGGPATEEGIEQITFDQAVATSQLTPEQQATLKALSD